MKQFILTVEGPNLEDLEEIELPDLPKEGDPIETRFGTCVVVRTESVADGSGHDGRIVCRMPQQAGPLGREDEGRDDPGTASSFDFRPAKHTVGMAEAWVPPLYLRESAGRCRLTLAGLTHGDGRTLQEAADDLIARLLDMVLFVRTAGLACSTDLPPPDYRLLDFLWELGERVACGEDIRERVFGPIASLDTSV